MSSCNNFSKAKRKEIRKAVRNVFENEMRVSSKDRLVATYKEYCGQPDKYPKSLTCKNTYNQSINWNIRATNDYIDRKAMAILVNPFVNPLIKQHFQNFGIEIDEEVFALSNIVQLIYRMRCRRGEGHKVSLFIPSKRIRDILSKFLDGKIY